MAASERVTAPTLRGTRLHSVSEEEDLSNKLAQSGLTESEPTPLTRRLETTTSPYLKALAATPVAWQSLDDETIQLAKEQNKLIFLNIGFASCHFCQLTIEDSFSHSDVADLLNKSFIPIAVDREERPDIDAVYMNYIQAVNRTAGWPINVFLTPQLEPVYGGTYWAGPDVELVDPNGEKINDEERLDFLIVLQRMEKVWKEQEDKCRQEASDIVTKLRDFAAEGTLGTKSTSSISDSGLLSAAAPKDPSGPSTSHLALDSDLDLDQLEEAYTQIAGTFDSVNGGFGMAPKFPTPPKLSFLLRLSEYPQEVTDIVGNSEVATAKDIALHTLRKLRQGGLRDHIGGGFARYCITADWTVPHFEKMTTDNALLLGVYLDAWLATSHDKDLEQDNEFKDISLELVQYLTSSTIQQSNGGFVTSIASDSYYRKGDRQMREGAYYFWTKREFESVLQSDDEAGQQASAVAAAHWNVLAHGNIGRDQDPNDDFINQNILYTIKDAAALGKQFGMSAEDAQKHVETARRKLKAHREQERVAPARDTKIVTSIQGMVISALVRTSAVLNVLNQGKAKACLEAAVRAAELVKETIWNAETKVLSRSLNDTLSPVSGFAEDYAFLVDALLELYLCTGKEAWLKWADELQRNQIKLFYDSVGPITPRSRTSRSSCGGFYSTPEDQPHVILRLKDGMDTATPSVNALSANNLFRLGAMLADTEYLKLAQETINAFEVETLQYPWLFLGILGNVVTARLGAECIIVDDMDTSALKELAVKPRAGPRCVLYKLQGDENMWLASRNPLVEGLKTGVYTLHNGHYEASKVLEGGQAGKDQA